MALSNRINFRGGQSSSVFAWIGTNQTWTNGLSFSVPARTTENTACTLGTGIIRSNCKLYYNVNYGNLGGYSGDVFSIEVAEHGTSSWTSIETVTSGPGAGTGTWTGTIDLSTYVGHNLDIRVKCYNAGGSLGSMGITRFDITNA